MTLHGMRACSLVASAAACFATAGLEAAESTLVPGLYETEVRISLPNVQDVAPPLLIRRCVTAGDIASGRAFFLLSDNPLKQCNLEDVEAASSLVTYRIECPGPNRGSALAQFQLGDTTFRGTIRMNMGGKNMTMSESQSGRRLGQCP